MEKFRIRFGSRFEQNNAVNKRYFPVAEEPGKIRLALGIDWLPNDFGKLFSENGVTPCP